MINFYQNHFAVKGKRRTSFNAMASNDIMIISCAKKLHGRYFTELPFKYVRGHDATTK